MSDEYCTDCKRHTDVVYDQSAGDTICSECGLVLQSRHIDETSEWRTFADESTADNDPVRVGSPTNPLLAYGGLSTVITGKLLPSSLCHWQNRGSDPDRRLAFAFKTIASMADRLEIVTTIKDRANEIYKKVVDQNPSKGRNQNALMAASLFIACRQEQRPRTVKEICSVANGVTKKPIGQEIEYIIKQLNHWPGSHSFEAATQASDFIKRFCSNLGMGDYRSVRAAQEAAEKLGNFDIRRRPSSLAAAVVYIVTQLSADTKPLRDISVATGVAEGTIRDSYKDLYPHIPKIVPNWYAKEQDVIKKLSCP